MSLYLRMRKFNGCSPWREVSYPEPHLRKDRARVQFKWEANTLANTRTQPLLRTQEEIVFGQRAARVAALNVASA